MFAAFPICHWSSSGIIKSIQAFTITIASGAASNTATIASVNTANAAIFLSGWETTATSSAANAMSYCTLTNSTTVTATRNTATTNTATISGTVVEFQPSAVASIQYGTITLASVNSNTATISAVNTARAFVIWLGMITTVGGMSSSVLTNCELTNSTTVTAARGGTTGTNVVSFCVVELTSAAIKSVQQRSLSMSNTNVSENDTITSVSTANSIIVWGGQSSVPTAPSSASTALTLTDSTTVTATRVGTASTQRVVKYTVVEFQPGILKSAVQGGTTAMASVVSNTTTITGVNTSKSMLITLNASTNSVSTTAYNRWLARMELTNSTTVTATRGTNTDTSTPSWQVVEFA